jgi:hypothetical protein
MVRQQVSELLCLSRDFWEIDLLGKLTLEQLPKVSTMER